MSENERVGKLICVVASASVFVWFLLSQNYNSEYDLLANFYYTMSVYKIEFFCEEVRSSLWPHEIKQECWDIIIKTKHLVLFSLLLGTNGYLIWKSLLPNPIPNISKILDEWNAKRPKKTSKNTGPAVKHSNEVDPWNKP